MRVSAVHSTKFGPNGAEECFLAKATMHDAYRLSVNWYAQCIACANLVAAMATSTAHASECPPLLSSVRMLVEVRSGYACAPVPAAGAWPPPISIERTALAVRFDFCVSVMCVVIHGYWHRYR